MKPEVGIDGYYGGVHAPDSGLNGSPFERPQKHRKHGLRKSQAATTWRATMPMLFSDVTRKR